MIQRTSTMSISLPKNLKEHVKQRTIQAHYGTPSDYIRGLIREDIKRCEEERLETELIKGLRSGKGIPMTKEAWKRMRAEAAKIIQSKRT
jgi:Arc/MetJ-type ribon-helix-helix transcriptional regulator